MKLAVPNPCDGTFDIEGHVVPMLVKPHLQGRLAPDERVTHEIDKAYEDLKRGATAPSFITSF